MQNCIKNAKDSQTKQRKRSLPYSLLLLVPIIPLSSESEKPSQRVSNADRKVFANPESFCDILIIG